MTIEKAENFTERYFYDKDGKEDVEEWVFKHF